ncbi:MAG: hypothetical protein H0V82_01395 [Candidatus Protochlamydia sp.]|nr:hypothetical protein [Candidatus Protochlamydia sp.]
MLAPIPMLNKEEVKQTLDKIFELRPFWSLRHPNFFSLGTALYLDKQDPASKLYDSFVQSNNYFLRLHFAMLYDRLLETLKNELKQEVQYEPTLSLPGFHIFLASQEFVEKGASIHFDLQFKKTSWSHYKEVKDSRPLSFTLALALPRLGGGLNYWNKTFDIAHPFPIEETAQKLPKYYVPYETGKIVLHEGMLMHQIAPAKEFFEEDKRITLQGHALFCDGCWRVYW